MPSDGEQTHRPRGSVDLVESSILDTIIPASTESGIEDALNGSVERLDNVSSSPLAHITQRQSLFFDESVDVYVVLQTPFYDEHALRSYLARLVVNLEAQVISGKPENHDGPAQRETIFSASVQGEDQEDPLIIVQQPDDPEDDDGHIFVVWKLPVLLSRPQRIRPQNPSITFFASANLRSGDEIGNEVKDEKYMPSQVPAGLNLLESFSNDGAMGSIRPHLSSLRVSRMLPTTKQGRSLLLPLQNISRHNLRIYPAFTARVKYAKPNSTPSNPAVLASLDVDITPYAGTQTTLESVSFKVAGGLVDDLNQTALMKLPSICFPGDDMTFMYRLSPSNLEIAKTNVKPVHIVITARVMISPTCQPLISLRWTTTIDFSIPVNPGFTATTIASSGRENRPSNLSISSSTFDTLPTLALKPDSLPSTNLQAGHNRSNSIPDFGVTMTFTSSPSPHPTVGEQFSWEVFIVNRSDRPRRLALVPIARRRRPASHTPSINRPVSRHSQTNKTTEIADAVTDENVLHAIQRNATVEPTEILCLSTDVRIGPLAPSACQAIELRFLPLKAGVLGLECVRVVDMGTQEHVDIKDLPSIIVGEELQR